MLEQKRLVGAVRTCVESGLLVLVIADDGRNLDYRFEPGPGRDGDRPCAGSNGIEA